MNNNDIGPLGLRFGNRTLSDIVKSLAQSTSDANLQQLFFRYGLSAEYDKLGQMTAKAQKVLEVFKSLDGKYRNGDQDSGTKLELIVEDAVKELDRKSQSEGRVFSEAFPDLVASLRLDGFQMSNGILIKIVSPTVQPAVEEGLLERLLDKHGFTVAKRHLKQAYDNYARGHWEAANASIRSFIQDVFDQIAIKVVPDSIRKDAGGARRKLLEEKGIIDGDIESKLVVGFFQFANGEGSHPGISNESDCRLRRYMAVALALYYLEKLELHVETL